MLTGPPNRWSSPYPRAPMSPPRIIGAREPIRPTIQPLASVATLISEPARGRILLALLDGRSLPSTELAKRAGITCQTASSHLAKLTEGGLLQVIPQGRHRYYRIANARVAELLESIARFAPRRETCPPEPKSLIEIARTCYNHLAGSLGVRITEAIVGQGLRL